MNRMVARIGLASLALSTIVLHGCDSSETDETVRNTDFVASAEFSHSLDVTDQRSMRVEGINGTVVLRATPDASSVSITGEKRVGSESLSDATAFLQRLKVVVTESGNEIVARTEQPGDSGGRECIVDYDITVPAHMEIDISHVNGVVLLHDIGSSTHVNLINGTLTSDVDLPAGGTVDMTVINGTMHLEIPTTTSASVTASVTNGEINVSDLVFTSQQSTDHSISGTLGGGDGSIRLTVINGILTLDGRRP